MKLIGAGSNACGSGCTAFLCVTTCLYAYQTFTSPEVCYHACYTDMHLRAPGRASPCSTHGDAADALFRPPQKMTFARSCARLLRRGEGGDGRQGSALAHGRQRRLRWCRPGRCWCCCRRHCHRYRRSDDAAISTSPALVLQSNQRLKGARCWGTVRDLR